MNYILGSGLISFIAKIMYPNFCIIPTGKSRFYQFDVATCDDYIFCSDIADNLIKEVFGNFTPLMFIRAISSNGQLIFGQASRIFINQLLMKTYGDQYNQLGDKIIRMEGFIYNKSCTDLFTKLEPIAKKDFKDFIISGNKILSIDADNKVIITRNGVMEYDKIINTIPLDALHDIIGIQHDLQTLDLHTFVIETDDLDFEGASELLVIDETIDFHKCTKLRNNIYQFFSTKDVGDIISYMKVFMKNYQLLSGTCVKKAIPIGSNITMHKDLEKYGIYSVGSCAQWDDMMDMSSCINRLNNLGL